MFDSRSFDAHESVTYFSDAASGLRGIVAIHSTRLGPAIGGCRAWFYDNDEAALQDALRLSRGMSYKNAVAGLPMGGGKAVIIREPGKAVTEAQFEAFGRIVQQLNGRYITAEDVGVSVTDMGYVARNTSFVSGLHHEGAAVGGDPSPKTAYGVYCGILAAVQARLSTRNLKGLSVAVQGLGSVGRHLCGYLHEAGVKLVVADINAAACEAAKQKFGATVVSVDEILFQDVDVVAPCALGAILNEQSIPKILAPIIAGGANNQLATLEDGQRLHDRHVLYAPDYVINAGGIICATAEYLHTGNEKEVWDRVAGIGKTLAEIFSESTAKDTPTNVVADALALRLIEKSNIQ
ncbi:Leu/Phe/Val dehydrogenase [Stenotrophobium rhamnosiphilum]|uniref:Amino acid dehydrogenase n=1 Tax=Stenotrophobium rhamnosiphilum TaxID=2029166 RepID=A0A2T5ME43_9GAMM|nr:Glu/Leu/Phe/Val dehydrogenase dimerization domain-containing protein [Stenotrophobium rhamnosiphilum]PTU30850.1 amino acid dehydrogenase [Stenotrophobium rhamnosiphilum]